MSASRSAPPDTIGTRLEQFCRTVGLALDEGAPAGELLESLVDALRDHPDEAALWLLHAVATGWYPSGHSVDSARHAIQSLPTAHAAVWLLDHWWPDASDAGRRPATAEIVTGAVLMDVTSTSGHDLHTGIQRVVRAVAPRWQDRPELIPVAWDADARVYRRLTPLERRRIFDWSGRAAVEPSSSSTELDGRVIPYGCRILLVEPVPEPAVEPLVVMADTGSNVLAAIGYDLIPLVSADLVPRGLPGHFGSVLRVMQRCEHIAAISEAAAQEFVGFAGLVPGPVRPTVSACPLPSPPVLDGAGAPPTDRSEVLMVGSFEPRKNHLAVLFAAEVLWREGIEFDLHLVGGMSWAREVQDEVDHLRGIGRPLHQHHRIDDAALAERYRRARFTVLPSLHEGYGLPVVESIEAGVPVLTSGTGSLGEIARHGGCLTVDPYDDDSIVLGMRRLLTDDRLIDELRAELRDRPGADWAAYADEVWAHLVDAVVPAP